MRAEIRRQELKHNKQWEELKSRNIANEQELEQIQVQELQHNYKIIIGNLTIISVKTLRSCNGLAKLLTSS